MEAARRTRQTQLDYIAERNLVAAERLGEEIQPRVRQLQPEFAAREGFTILPVSWTHTLAAGALPLPHRDPFDRLLAARAIVEGYDLLSVDTALDGLGVSRVW